nr:unnamed protein product [Callosobruchus analis]
MVCDHEVQLRQIEFLIEEIKVDLIAICSNDALVAATAYRLPTKMPQIESGYKKASSDNLPCVDSAMIQDFFASNSDFVSAEVRHVKTKNRQK